MADSVHDKPAPNSGDAGKPDTKKPRPRNPDAGKANVGMWIGAGIGAGIGSAAVAAALLYASRSSRKRNAGEE